MAQHRAASFAYRLSILQMEVSRTQVFELPALDTHIVAQAPPRLRTLFNALDAATDSLIEEARFAA